MRLTSVEIDGLRGRETSVDLDATTVIQGINGAGKTTVAESILLSVTQRLPGQDTDKAGMVATGPLLDRTAGGQPWRVVVRDDEGCSCGFAFRATDTAGVRQVLAPAHGEPAAPGDNAAAREAIAQRYGGALGVALLDLEALRRMEPVELERAVLALCASSSTWTPEQVLREVAERALGDAKRESVDLLDGHPLDVIEQHVTDAVDVRDALEKASRAVATLRSQANSDVRATRADIDTPLPEVPEPAELSQLEADVAAAEREARLSQEGLGAARERHQAARQRIQEWCSGYEQRIADARTAQQGAGDRLRQQEQLLERVRMERDEAERRIGKLRRSIEDAERAGGAAAVPATEIARARQDVADAEHTHARHERDAAEASKASVAANKRLREALVARSECDSDEREISRELAEAERRHAAYGEGMCPTCRQRLPEGFDDGSGQLDVARRKHSDVVTAAQHPRNDVRRYEDEIGRASDEVIRVEQHVSEAGRALRAARGHLQDLELRSAQTADAQSSRLKAQKEEVERRIEQLGEDLRNAEQLVRDANEEKARADRVLRGCEVEQCPVSVEAEQRAETVADETARAVRRRVAVNAEARTRAMAKVRARETAAERRAEAEERRALAQAWHDVWRCAAAALPGVQADATAGMVAPLTGPVAKMAARYAPQLGDFVVESGARPRIGWRRGDTVVPLSALSAGEAALTLLMLAASMHVLAESALRLVLVDGVEVLDYDNRAAFAELARALVRGGRLDQVIVCCLPSEGWDGWTVVQMSPAAAMEAAA